jgi:hypothetical protein
MRITASKRASPIDILVDRGSRAEVDVVDGSLVVAALGRDGASYAVVFSAEEAAEIGRKIAGAKGELRPVPGTPRGT